MNGEILSGLLEITKVPGLMKEVYGDLAKPGVSQVGKMFGTILGLGNTALWPIAFANGAAEIALRENLERLRIRLSKIPIEQVIPAVPEIGVPLAEKIAISRDVSIAVLYVELLAKASIESQSALVHPAFIAMLEALSPDEAYLLPYFNNRLPKIDIKLSSDGGVTFRYVLKNKINLSLPRPLEFPINFSGYLNNLQRLGIIEISDTLRVKEDPDPYLPLEAVYRALAESMTTPDSNEEAIVNRGMISATEFGKLFIRACTQTLN